MEMLPLKDLASYLAAGVATGICSGFFGIGGAIVLIPLLILGFGLTQTAATGTSLVALLLPVGLLGVLNYYHAGKINGENIKMGLIIAVGIFLGAYLGSVFAIGVGEATLRRLFALLLFGIAIRLFMVK